MSGAVLLMLAGCAPGQAVASTAPHGEAAAPATEPKVAPKTILFIGNSFTQGAHSAARNWRAGSVTDLNKAGYGGVPALFKLFTEQAGLDYRVSLETQGGKTLGFHYDERRAGLRPSPTPACHTNAPWACRFGRRASRSIRGGCRRRDCAP